jgi:crotonobetainyl-CoA:carnitine CoA-transferase CaiB-like acyl-CoA transferase
MKAGTVGAGYLQFNRNKRAMTLDTTTEEGRSIAAKLIASADVVVANMPDKVMRANGLDYESLKAIKPDIILASATAYGRGGPYSERVGFDGIGQVMSGAVFRTGAPDRPYRTAVPYIDHSSALLLAIGVMMALYHRQATGEGQEVEGALLPVALSIANALIIEETMAGRSRERIGNAGQAIAPCDLFHLEDGWILVQVTGKAMFRRWCGLVGEEGWAEDPRFASDELRAAEGEQLNAKMQQWCDGKAIAEACAALDEARIPASPMLSPKQAAEDEHVRAMGFFRDVDYPGLPRPAPVIETPFRLSTTPGTIRSRPPELGEHTDALLGELGYSADDIAGFRERGIV